MLACKDGAYPWVEHPKGALLRQALALPANIRLDWKSSPGTSALAYFLKIVNYDSKKFYDITP
jgi:hypothetical protein